MLLKWNAAGDSGQRLLAARDQLVWISKARQEAARQDPLFGGVILTGAGRILRSPEHKVYRPRGHFSHQILFCLGGSGRLWQAGFTHRIQKGRAYWISAHQGHRYESDPKDPWSKIMASALGDGVEAFRRKIGVDGRRPELRLKNGAGRIKNRLLSVLAAALSKSPHSHLLASAEFKNLLVFLLEESVPAAPIDPYEPVFALMKNRLGGKLSLAEMAEVMGKHPSVFRRNFTRETGDTPVKTFLRMKILRARTLLGLGHPVGQVARELGFEDPLYFSRFFRSRVGRPPRDHLGN